MVRFERGGVFSFLVQSGPPMLLRDVEPAGGGSYLLADAGNESIVLRLRRGTLRTLVSELDDGDPYNGLPVDRPYAVALVPHVWLTTPYTAALGQSYAITVRTWRQFAGHPLLLAVSDAMGPSSVPGVGWTSHLNLRRARVFRARVDAAGQAVFALTVPSDPALLGEELHLQAWLPAAGELSNYAALPVR